MGKLINFTDIEYNLYESMVITPSVRDKNTVNRLLKRKYKFESIDDLVNEAGETLSKVYEVIMKHSDDGAISGVILDIPAHMVMRYSDVLEIVFDGYVVSSDIDRIELENHPLYRIKDYIIYIPVPGVKTGSKRRLVSEDKCLVYINSF